MITNYANGRFATSRRSKAGAQVGPVYRDLPAIADDPHPLRALLWVALVVYRHVPVIVVRQPTVSATIAENPHSSFIAPTIGADDFGLSGSREGD